jgi:hypothetical protein
MEMELATPPEDVARLRAAIERAEPPTALRRRVGRQLTEAREQRAHRRRASLGVLAAAGALIAGTALLALPRGSPPTVVQVVRVASAAPRAPAPPVDPADRSRLAAHVGDVWFPSWRSLRWRPVGRSNQAIAGRSATTVYYARDDGARIAYTIVASGTLPWPEDTRVVTYGWTRLSVYSAAGRRVIGWRKLGHQCLITGPRSLPQAVLLGLAAGDA